MDLSERTLEDICIALMRAKDSNGRYRLDLSQLSDDIFTEFQLTGRVCLNVVQDE